MKDKNICADRQLAEAKSTNLSKRIINKLDDLDLGKNVIERDILRSSNSFLRS